MRCFVGIPIPEVIKSELLNIQNKLKTGDAKVKWVSKKNLHLTLKFFGDIGESELNLAREALKGVKTKKFRIDMGTIDSFPRGGDAKVIWIDLNPREEILNLHGDIELRMGSLFKKDEKFSVHLTLGRVKMIRNKKSFHDSLEKVETKNSNFLVSEFYLYRSELTKDGPVYTVLERYSLI